MNLQDWQYFNIRYFEREMLQLWQKLQQIVAPTNATEPTPSLPQIHQPEDFPIPCLEKLCEVFKLSNIERDILILCTATEVNFAFGQLLSQCLGNTQNPLPTIHLALCMSSSPEISIFDRNLPLFQRQFVETVSEGNLVTAPLKIAPWVMQYILGRSLYSDLRFPTTLKPTDLYTSPYILPESYQDLVEEIDLYWENANDCPITQLSGNDPEAHKFIATAICDLYSYQPVYLDANAFDQDPILVRQWLNQWKSQSRLFAKMLLLELNDHALKNPNIQRTITELIANSEIPIILSTPERQQNFNSQNFDVPGLTPAEQKQQWIDQLGEHALELNDHIGKIVAQFNVTLSNIETISKRALIQIERRPDKPEVESLPTKPLHEIIWQLCCTESRTQLEGLVERIDPKTTWDELILPQASTQILKQIIATIRQRAKVYDQWNMGGNSRRGMGITSLFYGPSGTGKTTAAEIIAHDLKLDLYRVDLSQVSSKYIGETEKNLKKVFASAESSGAVLLFDEADSIIGKRSEVKDARDRYANQEVGYLLQAMENYSGLAILTTNLPNSLDPAFMRRIRFSIRFDYPTAEQRAEIWQRNFPASVPTAGLSFPHLAQLNVSGASIRNIALGAAFLAADDNDPVQMKHILEASYAECQKLGRSITDQEIRRWV
jgi:ATPase family associated with various cellular activities (AAA)